MSLLIPNMKMPEHCGECRFAVDGWCYAYGKPNIDALANDGRTNFFPLVHVPPHGRLIDADALDAYLKTAAIMADGEAKEAYIDARAEARTMPVIISEEPSEEQMEYEAQVEAAQYCEMYEPSYDPETGAL